MNLRIFLTGSSVFLLSWMGASYLRALPSQGYLPATAQTESAEDSLLEKAEDKAALLVQH